MTTFPKTLDGQTLRSLTITATQTDADGSVTYVAYPGHDADDGRVLTDIPVAEGDADSVAAVRDMLARDGWDSEETATRLDYSPEEYEEGGEEFGVYWTATPAR